MQQAHEKIQPQLQATKEISSPSQATQPTRQRTRNVVRMCEETSHGEKIPSQCERTKKSWSKRSDPFASNYCTCEWSDNETKRDISELENQKIKWRGSHTAYHNNQLANAGGLQRSSGQQAALLLVVEEKMSSQCEQTKQAASKGRHPFVSSDCIRKRSNNFSATEK